MEIRYASMLRLTLSMLALSTRNLLYFSKLLINCTF